MGREKILVVDDEEVLVEFIKMRLEDKGYLVETANDGTGGLLKMEQTQPDLVILDIFMEPMDGYTMLKQIRRNEKFKDTPVIMLTASGKKKEIYEQEGISDYIHKPFDTKDFLERVDKVLKAKK